MTKESLLLALASFSGLAGACALFYVLFGSRGAFFACAVSAALVAWNRSRRGGNGLWELALLAAVLFTVMFFALFALVGVQPAGSL